MTRSHIAARRCRGRWSWPSAAVSRRPSGRACRRRDRARREIRHRSREALADARAAGGDPGRDAHPGSAPDPRGEAGVSRAFEIFAPAKLNLCLYVGPVREDGLHELCSLFVPLSLADRLVVSEADEDRVFVAGDRGPRPDRAGAGGAAGGRLGARPAADRGREADSGCRGARGRQRRRCRRAPARAGRRARRADRGDRARDRRRCQLAARSGVLPRRRGGRGDRAPPRAAPVRGGSDPRSRGPFDAGRLRGGRPARHDPQPGPARRRQAPDRGGGPRRRPSARLRVAARQ